MSTYEGVDAFIASSSENQLRAVLFALCEDSDIDREANRLFVLLQNKEAARKLHNVGTKRKATDLQICMRCKDAFDPEDNPKKGCHYHDGELEADDEAFVDHDEDCHGPIDSKENRREYPESFIWTCCDKDGTSEGCSVGRHVSAGDKKGRYGVSSGSSEDESKSNTSEDEDEEEEEEDEEY